MNKNLIITLMIFILSIGIVNAIDISNCDIANYTTSNTQYNILNNLNNNNTRACIIFSNINNVTINGNGFNINTSIYSGISFNDNTNNVIVNNFNFESKYQPIFIKASTINSNITFNNINCSNSINLTNRCIQSLSNTNSNFILENITFKNINLTTGGISIDNVINLLIKNINIENAFSSGSSSSILTYNNGNNVTIDNYNQINSSIRSISIAGTNNTLIQNLYFKDSCTRIYHGSSTISPFNYTLSNVLTDGSTLCNGGSTVYIQSAVRNTLLQNITLNNGNDLGSFIINLALQTITNTTLKDVTIKNISSNYPSINLVGNISNINFVNVNNMNDKLNSSISYFGLNGTINTSSNNNIGWFPNPSIYYSNGYLVQNQTSLYNGTNGGLNSDLTPNSYLTFYYKDAYTCTEDWIQQLPLSCNGIISSYTIYYLDNNSCGTYINLPINNGTIVPCCVENFINDNTACNGFNYTIQYIDYNDCNTTFTLPSDNNTIVNCTINNGGGLVIKNVDTQPYIAIIVALMLLVLIIGLLLMFFTNIFGNELNKTWIIITAIVIIVILIVMLFYLKAIL